MANIYPKISSIEVGKPVTTVLLITGIEERSTKNRGSYCIVSLSDGERQITAKQWNMKKEDFKLEEKTLGSFTITAKYYQENIDYEISNYGNAPVGCDILDFVIKAPYRGEDMYDRILITLQKAVPDQHPDGTPSLAHLVKKLYEEHKDELLYWSAAKTMHHNCYGGLLYHTYRMLMNAYMMLKVYTAVDTELLLCGVCLHDIGKLAELDTDDLGIADYTVPGNLFGHALIGIQMIDEAVASLAASGIALDAEKVMLLKHMVASHHGELEWGAITQPATPEATLLSFIDNIDAKMYVYEETLKDMDPGQVSEPVFMLGRARVYKPGAGKDPE